MTRWLRVCGLVVALNVLFVTVTASWATDQTVMLMLGTGSAFSLDRPFKTVLIGDPNVVDVVTRDERSVFFEPVSVGATNVVFVDENSIAIVNVGILVCKAGASTRIAFRDSSGCDEDQHGQPKG